MGYMHAILYTYVGDCGFDEFAISITFGEVQ
jgi:hypothetical protein